MTIVDFVLPGDARPTSGPSRRRPLSTCVDFIVPGDIGTLTGGYIYDRRVVEGLKALGWTATVHSFDTSFPTPTRSALRHARNVLAAIPRGRLVVIDGLALGGSASILRSAAQGLSLCGLVHHPLALETGLDTAAAAALKRAESESLAAVHHVIVTSRWTRRALADYGVRPDRITVVEPGVDPAPPRRPSSFEQPRPTVPADRGVDSAPPRRPSSSSASAPGSSWPARPPSSSSTLRLLCVGSLTARKGHGVLFEALGKLADREWQLVCAGSLARDPALVARLRVQIEQLSLGARIVLAGELAPEDLGAQYANCDLFVLASALEGYGMALTEALARGIPIIATTAGAIPDTVPAGTGLLVPPEDSAALARALASVMDDPGALARLSAAALAARTTLPGWDRTVERFAAALAGLAGT